MLNLKKQRLLVIAPHPDDEVIGCAGLIKRIKSEGGRVYVMFLTVGDTKDFTKKGLSTAKERQIEIEKVAKFLKFDGYSMEFSGNDYHLKLDTLGQKKLMGVIERESKVSIEKIKPTIVAFPSFTSYNQDHRVAALAALAATRPAPSGAKHFVPIVLSYEEAADQWSHDVMLTPNLFVPLSKNQLDAKMKSLKLYKSQLRAAPNLRAPELLETLAILRGAQCGQNFAEAYSCLRMTT